MGGKVSGISPDFLESLTGTRPCEGCPLQEGTDLAARAAAAERAGIGRAVWKDGQITEAQILPLRHDRVTALTYILEKGPRGLSIKQMCLSRDLDEHKVKVYLRSRPDEGAPWGAGGGWELKYTVEVPY